MHASALRRTNAVLKPPRRSYAVSKCALPSVLLACAILLPFLNKAFNIDDTLFLRAAEQVLHQPLHPSAFTVVWDTDVPVRASSGIFVSGPVTAFLLVPAVLLGGAEWTAHLVLLVLMCCGLAGTVALAMRLGLTDREATLAGLFVSSTPAVLGMTSTAMPDIPTMAFGVWAIERLIAWRQEGRFTDAVLASVLLAAASLTRAYALLLLVPAAVLMLHTPGARNRWAPLASALVLTGVVLWAMQDPAAVASDHTRFFSTLFKSWTIRSNIIALGTNWVCAVPLALSWLLLRGEYIDWRVALATGAFVALARPTTAPWWTIITATLGLTVVFDIVIGALRRRDLLQISAGLWLLIPCAMILYFHVPAKYYVASAPAAAFVVVRALRDVQSSWRRTLVPVILACGAFLGVLILRADAVLAGAARESVERIVAPLIMSGERVWIVGHWGFQWYAEKAGARSLTVRPREAQVGDKIVASRIDGCEALAAYPNRVLVSSTVYSEPGGRLMNRNGNAGFYSNMWGYLPWAWSRSELNRFEVWQVLP